MSVICNDGLECFSLEGVSQGVVAGHGSGSSEPYVFEKGGARELSLRFGEPGLASPAYVVRPKAAPRFERGILDVDCSWRRGLRVAAASATMSGHPLADRRMVPTTSGAPP